MAMGLWTAFDNTFFFLTFVTAVFGGIGAFSRSFKFAAYSAFLAFVFLAMKSQYTFYINMLYVIIALMVPITMFQFWSLAVGGSGGEV